MYELYPYFTNDGSVGLFSPEADDIYHSTYGALTEAYEKFIFPAELDKFLKKNKKMKVLDICYGIGYNSKSLLNTFLEITYNDTIDSNNIKCNEKIDTNNIKPKIYIKAIDTDKNLACLSPFFITGKKNIKNNKLSFSQDKIKRMLSEKPVVRFKIKKEVNIILLQKILDKIDFEVESLLFSKKYSKYFDHSIIAYYTYLRNKWYKYNPLRLLNAFLHNI